LQDLLRLRLLDILLLEVVLLDLLLLLPFPPFPPFPLHEGMTLTLGIDETEGTDEGWSLGYADGMRLKVGNAEGKSLGLEEGI